MIHFDSGEKNGIKNTGKNTHSPTFGSAHYRDLSLIRLMDGISDQSDSGIGSSNLRSRSNISNRTSRWKGGVFLQESRDEFLWLFHHYFGSNELSKTIVPVPMAAVRALDFSATKKPESGAVWNARSLVKQGTESKAPAEKHAAGLPSAHIAANQKRQKPIDVGAKPGAGLPSAHIAANQKRQKPINVGAKPGAGLPSAHIAANHKRQKPRDVGGKPGAGLPSAHIAANQKRQKPLDVGGKPGAGLPSGYVAANQRAQEVRNFSPEILAAGLPTPENTEIKTQQKRHFAYPSSGIPLMKPMTPNAAALVKKNALPAWPSEISATKSATPRTEDAAEKKELPKRSGIPTLVQRSKLDR